MPRIKSRRASQGDGGFFVGDIKKTRWYLDCRSSKILRHAGHGPRHDFLQKSHLAIGRHGVEIEQQRLWPLGVSANTVAAHGCGGIFSQGEVSFRYIYPIFNGTARAFRAACRIRWVIDWRTITAK
jgi:hypothetical protein